MNKQKWWLYLLALVGIISLSASADSRWGSDYFPNVQLIDHDGKPRLFFDDLIKGKIVAINFIYTSCPDTCPLETAQLTRVQNIIGDRLGKDVFFYSISIDPKADTPPVLKAYREKFGAKWMFLTGKEAEITELRKKLGLYIDEIQDGSNNHNVSMIIGNQATGRWMKRSPFENPYVLADQIGNWLDGWKLPPKGKDYTEAPQLRGLKSGERLFRTRCATCHTVAGVEEAGSLGPDLAGVSQRRERFWLMNWLKAPDQMLKNKDPIAMVLYQQYNNLAMPNMRLNQLEARALLAYIDEVSAELNAASPAQTTEHDHSAHKPHDHAASQETRVTADQAQTVIIANAWVREAVAPSTVSAGYMTLINQGKQAQTLTAISADLFERVEFHQMSSKNGMMSMEALASVTIPAKGQVTFAPGGKHLMLKQPKRQLVQGEQVQLTFRFASGKQQELVVEVEKR